MKKIYQKPATQVIMLQQTCAILTGSNVYDTYGNGPGGIGGGSSSGGRSRECDFDDDDGDDFDLDE